ncbi:MAG: RagB/SusD family nutrient uptake outer membrane protein [Bacteroidales bacterium]|nr:RagB/SusD family nutrient uptake outer membrane protein [Bacteroidales bacterium]
MKTRNIIFLGLLAMVLSFTSCEDFLLQEPRLSQTNELTLSTYDGLQKATLGAYTPLYSANWYGRNFVVAADLKGGNAKISPLNSGRFRTEYLWNNTPTASHGLWTTAYNLISRANNVINVIEDGFEETGVEQEDLDHLAAECKFLRALGHFDLVRLFCQPYSYKDEVQADGNAYGIPVILVSEIGIPARNTIEETYDQIVLDLLDAEAGLPETSSNGGTDPKGWATKYAAQALLARVYLYMEDWGKAAEYATKVIDNFPGRLYTAAEYTTWDNGGAWGTDAGVEVIFEVFGAEGNSSHANWDVISYIMNPGGYGDVGASLDVKDLYEAGDVRDNLFINTADFPNSFWTLKYPGKAPDGNLREDNIVVLRLAEMHLIRAEATLKGATTGVTADTDLNAIRSQRGASDISGATLTDVYQERRRELCFEGHELFDLARTQRGLTRNDFDGAVNQNIEFPNYMWAMPIPQNEIDANENMVQNPGYGESN